MPRIKSAQKALRQSIKKRRDNLQKIKSLKTAIKQYEQSLLQTDIDKKALTQSLALVYKAIDKANKTKVIKTNKARRLKSRFAHRITKSSKASS